VSHPIGLDICRVDSGILRNFGTVDIFRQYCAEIEVNERRTNKIVEEAKSFMRNTSVFVFEESPRGNVNIDYRLLTVDMRSQQ
jgi:hypothetical protein